MGSAAPVEIAVVIVNYNVKDFLVQCLSSLEASLEGIRSEIIVVDNASTDGSMEYVEPLFPEVVFVRLAENVGFGRANNIGFRRALNDGARFVLCLNPDTLISEDTMTTMLAYMNDHPHVGLAGCKLLNADGTFQLACRRGFPTPWASFCKVFGLQALFPRSPLFAQYNQTFRSDDETYFVDAVSGAFMLIRREALHDIALVSTHNAAEHAFFDEDFFMYGEDLDLCYRVTVAGWRVAYVHTTSIIHYKGESTRRSAINEIRVFYEAMEIFAHKHFGSSRLFLWFLRSGIALRSALAYLAYYWRETLLIVLDASAVGAALLIATKLWRGRWFAFPDTAYPMVFVVVIGVIGTALFVSGEYSPYSKPSVKRTFVGLMTSFFVLSTLPYFFKNYAFSRAVLVLTIAFSLVVLSSIRILMNVLENLRGERAERRVIVVGLNDITRTIIHHILSSEPVRDGQFRVRQTAVVGVVTTGTEEHHEACVSTESGLMIPVIGHVSYLQKLIREYRVDEVIITDTILPRAEMLKHIMEASKAKPSERASFRFAREYDDVIAAEIVERTTGVRSNPVVQYRITLWQYKLLKRCTDIVAAVFVLTIGLPFVYLRAHRKRQSFKALVDAFLSVLRGTTSIIGLYPVEGSVHLLGKIGLTGLAHIHSPERLSAQALRSINEFYAQHYSVWLDVEILVKALFR